MQLLKENISIVEQKKFWSKIKILGLDDCWEWIAGRTVHGGYGAFRLTCGRQIRAHRLAYALTRGDPGLLHVLHSCDNPPCCNPIHLWLGTCADNNHDCIAKGRNNIGKKNGSCTHPENNIGIRNPNAYILDEVIEQIRELYFDRSVHVYTQSELAKIFGISAGHVGHIVRGERRSRK